jgi:hypothetical protein
MRKKPPWIFLSVFGGLKLTIEHKIPFGQFEKWKQCLPVFLFPVIYTWQVPCEYLPGITSRFVCVLEQALVEAVTTQRHLACPKRFSNTFHMWKERALPTCPAPTWSIVHTMVHTMVASTSRRRKKSASYVCPIQLQENLSGIESKIYVGPKCKCGVSTQLKPWKYKTTRHQNIIQQVLNILGTMWCLNSNRGSTRQ